MRTALPALVTMLEGSADIRRGAFADALRAARAELVVWNAAAAGIADVTKCGLRGSPTVVKRVFAPAPRSDKAKQIDVQPKAKDTAEGLIAALFSAKAGLEGDLERLAAGL